MRCLRTVHTPQNPEIIPYSFFRKRHKNQINTLISNTIYIKKFPNNNSHNHHHHNNNNNYTVLTMMYLIFFFCPPERYKTDTNLTLHVLWLTTSGYTVSSL